MKGSARRAVTFGLLSFGLLWATTAGGLAQSPAPEASDDTLDAALAAVGLMNRVPETIRGSCQPGSPAMDGQTAVATCSYGDDTVFYASFADPASLAAAYEGLTAGTIRDTGTSCADGPFEGPWVRVDGAVAGRVVCQESPDGLLIVWTDERELVFGFLALGEGDFATLDEHWLAARLDAGDAQPLATEAPGMSPSEPPGDGPAADGEEIRQWAREATASSMYGSDPWSALQATGAPDTPLYGDHPSAWAPGRESGGPEWIELGYARAVVPREVVVWESSGSGFVTLIEARDEASGEWHTLWQGVDPSAQELVAFSPSLTPMAGSTRTIRITIDTDVPEWNEIDAVELVGESAGQ